MFNDVPTSQSYEKTEQVEGLQSKVEKEKMEKSLELCKFLIKRVHQEVVSSFYAVSMKCQCPVPCHSKALSLMKSAFVHVQLKYSYL